MVLRAQQVSMFSQGEDTPLFSGVAQRVDVAEFNPQPVAKQAEMFERDWNETAKVLKQQQAKKAGRK